MKGFFGGIEANKNCRRYLLTFEISHLGLAGGKLALKKAAGVGLAKAKLGLVGGKIALVKAKKAAPLVVAGKLGAAGLGAAGLGMYHFSYKVGLRFFYLKPNILF